MLTTINLAYYPDLMAGMRSRGFAGQVVIMTPKGARARERGGSLLVLERSILAGTDAIN